MTTGNHPIEGPAWGVGIETVSTDGTVLDTWFPEPFLGDTEGALRLKEAHGHPGGTGTHRLHRAEALDALRVDLDRLIGLDRLREVDRSVVVTFIADLSDAPLDAHDVHLRLHLLSHRRIAPGSVDLDGLDTILSDVVWTDHGPCAVAGFERVRLRMSSAGHPVTVTAVGRVPCMLDHVVPADVRIADARRVLLGAHLAPGTTVGPAGHCGPDSGSLGPSVIDGHLGSGVVIGAGTVIGVGAMTGISLGRRCSVAPGVHIAPTTRVIRPGTTPVAAAELEGHDDLVFRMAGDMIEAVSSDARSDP